MSIPVPIDPLGTLGGKKWTELDLSRRENSTYTIDELTPLGIPKGGIGTQGCSRLRNDGVIWFGYAFAQTTYDLSSTFSYCYGGNVPPRNHTTDSHSSAIEMWFLPARQKARVTFSLSPAPTTAYCSDDNWTTWTKLDINPIKDDIYIVETPGRVTSIAINTVNGFIKGNIIKIEVL